MAILENMKIRTKVLIGLGVIAVIMLGGCLFAGQKMAMIDDAYSELIDHEEVTILTNSRANRMLAWYARTVYAVVTETTEAGNERLSKELKATEANFREQQKLAKEVSPHLAADLDRAYAPANAALAACVPVIKAAESTSDPADVVPIATRMKQECEPFLIHATETLTSFNQTLSQRLKKESEQLTADTESIVRTNYALNAVGLLFGLMISLSVVAKGVVGPIQQISATMRQLADGKLSITIPGLTRQDELGAMAQTVQVFQSNALEVEKLRSDQERQRVQAETERKANMNRLATELEHRVGSVIEAISGSVERLQGSANALASTAEQTQNQSSAVAAATEEATSNVETVAAAGAELSASIAEIARQVTQSASTARDAAEEALDAKSKIAGLAESAAKIGEVISLINNIASQTNLLALNATIESARAGDAGKGFAVVANEVKSLAGQTGRATEDIAAQINAVQNETRSAVNAIEGIAKTVAHINELSASIASAVEEQGAATAEIARNVDQASQGTRDVANNIGGVAQAASQTGEMAQIVSQAALDLRQESDALRGSVTAFLRELRNN